MKKAIVFLANGFEEKWKPWAQSISCAAEVSK